LVQDLSALIVGLSLSACASGGSAAHGDCTAAAHDNSGRAPNDEERAAAEAMLTHWVDSWNRADGAAYGENYWPDAELVDPTGTISAGRAAIAQSHVALWSSIFKGSVVKGVVRRIVPLGKNFLLVDLDMELRRFAVAPPVADTAGGAMKARLKHLLEKRDGAWRIIAAQNTAVAAPPPKK